MHHPYQCLCVPHGRTSTSTLQGGAAESSRRPRALCRRACLSRHHSGVYLTRYCPARTPLQWYRAVLGKALTHFMQHMAVETDKPPSSRRSKIGFVITNRRLLLRVCASKGSLCTHILLSSFVPAAVKNPSCSASYSLITSPIATDRTPMSNTAKHDRG